MSYLRLKQVFLYASLLIGAQAHANPLASLDDKAVNCIDLAFRAHNIPNASFSSPSYHTIAVG
ncbi:MAG: hypothetical protein AAF988_03250, partial [Pseudomonadota bacterium]